jgi:hypothetical protein
VREHRFTLEIPHPIERIWALFQRYDLWTQYAPMVTGVEVIHPGDHVGNGLLRRVIYKLPLGKRGSALELVTDVEPGRGYTYTMLSRRPGNDQTGRVTLEPLGPDRTLLRFEERYNLTQPLLKPFEAQIYRFINKQNEASMRRASEWLSAHPEFHS